MSNKTFKILASVFLLFFVAGTFIAFERTSVILGVLCIAGACTMLMGWASLEPEPEPPKLDGYDSAVKLQEDKRTRKVIINTRRKQIKIIKGGKK